MTMPNYIVNWDELYELLLEELDDLGYKSIKDVQGVPKSKGLIADVGKVEGLQGEEVVSWEVDTSAIITAISYVQEPLTNGDSWEVWVNSRRIMESNFTHFLGDKKHWKIIQALNIGDKLKVIRRRKSGVLSPARVWVNVEYIDVLDNLEETPPPAPSKD